MKMSPEVIVCYGGTTSEREVSLRSGKAVADSLKGVCTVRGVDLTTDALPSFVDPKRHIIFPVLHGGYGEGGGLQADCESAGLHYVGCDAACSRLCMTKNKTKERLLAEGIPVVDGLYFESPREIVADRVVEQLGSDLILKPDDDGSSVGLYGVDNLDELKGILKKLEDRPYLVERRVRGRELSVGMVSEALGVVEILPRSGGLFDYKAKYTKGETDFLAPAPIPEEETNSLRQLATRVFDAVGGRDFARVDFLRDPAGNYYVLEVNTIPGMTELSILPRSAGVFGLTFSQLTARILEPALQRYSQSQ